MFWACDCICVTWQAPRLYARNRHRQLRSSQQRERFCSKSQVPADVFGKSYHSSKPLLLLFSHKTLLIYVLVSFSRLPAFPFTQHWFLKAKLYIVKPNYMLSYNNAHSSQNINIQMPTCGYLLSWFLVCDILHTTYLFIFI